MLRWRFPGCATRQDVIGQVVRLFGLTGARRLNDKVGLCTARDPDSGRYVVQLRGAEAETVKVKGANLDMHTQPSRVRRAAPGERRGRVGGKGFGSIR